MCVAWMPKNHLLDSLSFCFWPQTEKRGSDGTPEKRAAGHQPSQKNQLAGSKTTRARYCRIKHNPVHIHAMASLHNAHTCAAEAACCAFALLPSRQAMKGITALVYHITTVLRHVGCGHEKRRARRCTYRSRAIADEMDWRCGSTASQGQA